MGRSQNLQKIMSCFRKSGGGKCEHRQGGNKGDESRENSLTPLPGAEKISGLSSWRGEREKVCFTGGEERGEKDEKEFWNRK